MQELIYLFHFNKLIIQFCAFGSSDLLTNILWKTDQIFTLHKKFSNKYTNNLRSNKDNLMLKKKSLHSVVGSLILRCNFSVVVWSHANCIGLNCLETKRKCFFSVHSVLYPLITQFLLVHFDLQFESIHWFILNKFIRIYSFCKIMGL